MSREPPPPALPAQLALPLAPPAASYAPADLMEDASNAAALAWLRRPGEWPAGRLALWGPAAVGKTHLLRWAAARHGWWLWPGGGGTLRGIPAIPPAAPGVVLDAADAIAAAAQPGAAEAGLFHLINICAERRLPLLLAGRAPPARWPVALADLRSRLRGTHAVAVGVPGDALLAALLAKHFADRQLRVRPALVAWLLARLPRDPAALAAAAALLDAAALAAGGALTPARARAALAALPGFACGADPPGCGAHDDLMAVSDRNSPPGPGVG
jgi:chromosomal replication initiation ATPase DnaA